MIPRGPSRDESEAVPDPWVVRVLGWIVAEPYRADVLGDLLEEHRAGAGGRAALAVAVVRAGLATRWQWLKAAAPPLRRRRGGRRRIPHGEGASMYDHFSQDLGGAWASLRRSPGFAAAAVLTLALGTGSTLSIFTLLSGVLLSPLPYASPERLVHVQGSADGRYAVSMPVHREVIAPASSIREAAVWQGWNPIVGRPEQGIERRGGASVSWNYFRLLGTQPTAGRFFMEDDGEVGHAPVIVLSHSAWQELFRGDPAALGEDLVLDATPHTIVGVAPEDFHDPVAAYVLGSSGPLSFWRADPPVFFEARDDGGWTGFWSVARTRAGVEPGHLRGEIARIMKQVYPAWDDDGEWLGVRSFREVATGHLRPTLAALFSAGCLVLLIACANVANLLLSRATTRSREMSIRASLGATRARLVRQLFTESVLLSAAAVALGGALAIGMTPLLADLLSTNLRHGQSPVLDWKVGGFSALLVLTTAGVFGLFPALRGSDARLGAVMRSSRGADQGGGRARAFLIGVEVALGVVVLVSAVLLGRTLWNLWSVDPGFAAEGAVVTYVSLPPEFIDTSEEQNATVEGLERELSARPGITAVGIITDLPMSGAVNSTRIARPGDPETSDQVLVRAVSPGYFEAMGVPLVAGRTVRPTDRAASTPVAVINSSYAALLPDGGIGQTVLVRGQARQVVGVVGDVVEFRLEDGPGDRVLYTPYAQEDQSWMRSGFHVVLGTASGASVGSASLREAVARANPAALMSQWVRPIEHYLTEDLAGYRFRAFLVAFFATIALVLTAAGIAAVASYAVSRQTAEIGVRMALGASSHRIVRDVVMRFAKITAAGLCVGLFAAFAAGRSLSHFLVGVPPGDLRVFAVAAAVFSGVALLAVWIPARRAANVNPVQALQAQ